jgi:hypothetical protein
MQEFSHRIKLHPIYCTNILDFRIFCIENTLKFHLNSYIYSTINQLMIRLKRSHVRVIFQIENSILYLIIL